MGNTLKQGQLSALTVLQVIMALFLLLILAPFVLTDSIFTSIIFLYFLLNTFSYAPAGSATCLSCGNMTGTTPPSAICSNCAV